MQRFTTTDMTPDEIHEIGLQEVERIRRDMEAVIAEVGFQGDMAAFNTFLRTDPQFYYDSPEALLEGYQAVSKRLDPGLVKLLASYPVRPMACAPFRTRRLLTRPLPTTCARPSTAPARLVLRQPPPPRSETQI
ncbi:MAG: hypothetical protein CM15mP74_07880 [Halieaceae bacterium]|nr:MAG: hypothetical protein CM15mP74_07880 [Halieaceae bacterium]